METSPQLAIGKNIGLKKLLETLSSSNDRGFKHFLKRHYIVLEDSVYEQIEQKIQSLINQLKDPEEAPSKEIEENAITMVYTYLCAAIESVWLKHGADISNKPISYTSRIIKRNKNIVYRDLLKEIDKNFQELDEFTSNIIPDIEAEAVLENAFGHK